MQYLYYQHVQNSHWIINVQETGKQEEYSQHTLYVVYHFLIGAKYTCNFTTTYCILGPLEETNRQ